MALQDTLNRWKKSAVAALKSANVPVAVTAGVAMELTGANAFVTAGVAKLGYGALATAVGGFVAPLAAMAVASLAMTKGLDFVASKVKNARVQQVLAARNAITGAVVAAGLFAFMGPLAAATYGLAAVSAQRFLSGRNNVNGALSAATVVAAIAAPYAGVFGFAARMLGTALSYAATGVNFVTRGVVAEQTVAAGASVLAAAGPAVLRNLPQMPSFRKGSAGAGKNPDADQDLDAGKNPDAGAPSLGA